MVDIYARFGARRVVNAIGHATTIGGSVLSKDVIAAMNEANKSYTDMKDLEVKAGQHVAKLLGAEAAFITSGAAAGLVLGTAGCITGGDPELIKRLPDSSGLKNEVIIQKAQRYSYDKCAEVAGGKLVVVGTESTTSEKEIQDAMNDKTAAIFFNAVSALTGTTPEGALGLESLIPIARKRGVPVIVDAASNVFPPQEMKKYTKLGADIVVFGGKYFGAPSSTGIICGRRDLVQAAFANDFISFHTYSNRNLGRAMKVDRQSIIGLLVALENWMKIDYKRISQEQEQSKRRLIKALNSIDGITAVPAEKTTPRPLHPLDRSIVVSIQDGTSKDKSLTVDSILNELAEGNPPIIAGKWHGGLTINVVTLGRRDEQVIVRRLRQIIA